MLILDCTDCYTKVEFSQNTIQTGFDDIELILTEKKDFIKMFSVDDYIFEFVEYTKQGEKNCNIKGEELIHWIIGKYITPIPHLTYMVEEEIWFKMNASSVDKFIFFLENEVVISMQGMLFLNGEFKENLIHRFNINEIRNLDNDLVTYILKNYKEIVKPINIWNAFKCIGIYSEKGDNK